MRRRIRRIIHFKRVICNEVKKIFRNDVHCMLETYEVKCVTEWHCRLVRLCSVDGR